MNHDAKVRSVSRNAQRASMILFGVAIASSAGRVVAEEQSLPGDTIRLSATQQQTLLSEAGDLYAKAMNIAKTDSAEASELFTTAAQKYQLLVDSGVHNALLYRNLGNARLQSHQLGRAIANYELATQLAPNDRQLAVNLEFANSLVKGDNTNSDAASSHAAGDPRSLNSIVVNFRAWNRTLVGITGRQTIIWTLVMSSMLFWGLHIVRAFRNRFPAWRLAIIPLLLLVTSLTSAVLASTQPGTVDNGIIVTDKTTLHSGDGEQFDPVVSLDSAQGHRVQVLNHRGDWTQIKTRHGHTGWLRSGDVEELSFDDSDS